MSIVKSVASVEICPSNLSHTEPLLAVLVAIVALPGVAYNAMLDHLSTCSIMMGHELALVAIVCILFSCFCKIVNPVSVRFLLNVVAVIMECPSIQLFD